PAWDVLLDGAEVAERGGEDRLGGGVALLLRAGEGVGPMDRGVGAGLAAGRPETPARGGGVGGPGAVHRAAPRGPEQPVRGGGAGGGRGGGGWGGGRWASCGRRSARCTRRGSGRGRAPRP